MQLIAPDILAEARGLSVFLGVTGVLLGLLLWAFGWWGHRFWIVLFTTLVAGIFALASGPLSRVQPLVVAILLAVAAGFLALTLARVVAFAAGGVAGWLVVHAAVPAWDEPLLCFLTGGLLGLLLFRYWTMAVTSLAGTLLLVHSSLCLLDRPGKLDVVLWSGKQVVFLNWLCGSIALGGWIVQFLLERWRLQKERIILQEEQQLRAKAKEKEREARKKSKPPWWTWLPIRMPRQAA